MTSHFKPGRPSLLTVNIDGSLYREALAMAGPKTHLLSDPSALMHEALKTFIRVQIGRRLAALKGGGPKTAANSRRR